MKKAYLFLPLLLLASLFNSCYNENAELLYGNPNGNPNTTCNTVNSKFGADISPLINSKCAIPGCHDANAASNPAGITLQNYAQISAMKDRINVRAVIDKTMPENGPLLPAEIEKIKCWVAAGGPNN